MWCGRCGEVVRGMYLDFLSSSLFAVVLQRPQLDRNGCRLLGPSWTNGAKRGRGVLMIYDTAEIWTEHSSIVASFRKSPWRGKHTGSDWLTSQHHRSCSHGYLCYFLWLTKITSLGRILESDNIRAESELRNNLLFLLHSSKDETQVWRGLCDCWRSLGYFR